MMADDSFRYLAAHEEDLFRFLKEMVLQPSYSHNKPEVDAVGKIIVDHLAESSMLLEIFEQGATGNHLIFRSPACNTHNRSILLVGHMDTVFPPDSGFNWYREKGDRVFGPGVIDMKGGLAAAIFALKALDKKGLLAEIPVKLLCNSDEEIGSPTSREIIRKEAQNSMFGLVFECGGLGGEIVTGRKGKAGYTLSVTGQAGHAAFSGVDKASAILELARKIIAVEQLNDPGRQLVVNVGTVQGGIGPNTVPEQASAQIDTRYLTNRDGEDCADRLREITHNCSTPDTSGQLNVTSTRQPMEQNAGNQRLFEQILADAQALHISVKTELRSGVSDANEIAAAGIPVIDGMGPRGDCDHSDREYMIRHSLPEKTLLAATTIANSWQALNNGSLHFS